MTRLACPPSDTPFAPAASRLARVTMIVLKCRLKWVERKVRGRGWGRGGGEGGGKGAPPCPHAAAHRWPAAVDKKGEESRRGPNHPSHSSLHPLAPGPTHHHLQSPHASVESRLRDGGAGGRRRAQQRTTKPGTSPSLPTPLNTRAAEQQRRARTPGAATTTLSGRLLLNQWPRALPIGQLPLHRADTGRGGEGYGTHIVW